MASLRLGWASRSLMRAHREKPLGPAEGNVSLRTVPLQEEARRKPNFTHFRGRPSKAGPMGSLKAAFVRGFGAGARSWEGPERIGAGGERRHRPGAEGSGLPVLGIAAGPGAEP